MRVLKTKMNQYNIQVENLKLKLYKFSNEIEDHVCRAKRLMNHYDKAMIGQKVGFVGGTALALITGFRMGGKAGVLVATLSIGWTTLRAIEGLQLYNAGKPIIEEKKRIEEIYQIITKHYKDLCNKDSEVKKCFSLCEDQLAYS